MRKLTCALLAFVLVLSIPALALGRVDAPPTRVVRDTASTYYSNVPGWDMTLENWFVQNSATTYKITKIVVLGQLSNDVVYAPVGAGKFYNLSGTFGPVSVSIRSGASTPYSATSSDVHTVKPGYSAPSHIWYPNVSSRMDASYGKASVSWTQKLNSVYNASWSSAKPATMNTYTY